MFIVDDSGSMASRFMPEHVDGSNIDKSRCSNCSCSSTTTNGIEGNPPWYATQFNTIYYNPQVTYYPAIDRAGTPMTSYGSPWTTVKVNAFVGSSDDQSGQRLSGNRLLQEFERLHRPASNCRRNGIDTGNPFVYNSTSTNGYPNGTARARFAFRIARWQSLLLRHPAARALQRRSADDLHAVDHTDWQLRLSGAGALLPELDRRQQQQRDNGFDQRQAALPGRVDDQPYSGPLRTLPARRHRAVTATYGGRPNRTDCDERAELHLCRGDDQLRQLVRVLQHAHAVDEDRRWPCVSRGRRPLPGRTDHDQSRLAGQQSKLHPGRHLYRHASQQLVRQALLIQPERRHAAARGAVAGRPLLRRYYEPASTTG